MRYDTWYLLDEFEENFLSTNLEGISAHMKSTYRLDLKQKISIVFTVQIWL